MTQGEIWDGRINTQAVESEIVENHLISYRTNTKTIEFVIAEKYF